MRIFSRILSPLILLVALLLPAGGAAAAPAESTRTEQVNAVINNCNGELVRLEVTVHVVSKEQRDGSFIQRANIHGQGTGDQGNEYVFSATNASRWTSGGFYSFDERSRLISKGPQPNLVLLIHFDPATGLTIKADCRG